MSSNGSSMKPDGAGRVATQWKPGTSGNPAGSLVGRQTISLTATLRRKVQLQADRKRKRTGEETSGQRIADEIVDQLIDLALHCKVAKVKLMAIVTVLDRLDGKPVTPVAIAPAEMELVQRVRLAYDSVLRFAAANELEMTPAEAIAWVSAREPRAREILAEFITIDVQAEPAAETAADAAAAPAAEDAAAAPAAEDADAVVDAAGPAAADAPA